MIKIIHNGEMYSISQICRYNSENDLAFADYKSSVSDHVENIKTVLDYAGVEYYEECL